MTISMAKIRADALAFAFIHVRAAPFYIRRAEKILSSQDLSRLEHKEEALSLAYAVKAHSTSTELNQLADELLKELGE